MELTKKKTISALVAAGLFLIWVAVDLWYQWSRFEETLSVVGVYDFVSTSEMLKYFIYFVGRPYALFCLCMTGFAVVLVIMAFVCQKKDRMNPIIPIALGVVIIADGICLLATLKNVLPLVGAAYENGDGLKALLGMILTAAEGFTVIVFILLFAASVSAVMGKTFLKKFWMLPGVLYIVFAVFYYFGIGLLAAYVSESIVLSDVVTTQNIMQLFIAFAIGVTGYWLSLYMPPKTLANTRIAAEREVWEEPKNTEIKNEVQSISASNYKQGKQSVVNKQNSLAERKD